MRRSRPILALSAFLAMATAAIAEPQDQAVPAPIQVMIVGTFHFDNPGLDYRNAVVDDMLTPSRQAQIKAVADRLATFQPTVIGVEWSAADADKAYPKYLDGSLPETRDEAVQLGFRIARQDQARVVGLDSPMSLPFEAVFQYAGSHGQQAYIDKITRVSEANVAAQERALAEGGVVGAFRLLNDADAAMESHGLYRDTLRIGGGTEQPGVAATLAWYHRNLAICANLLQAARPGDRVIVFFGAGHLPLLRQCVQETPGYELIEPQGFLPD